MAALLLNIQPGDEVIVPAFTFVSSINAFVHRGARPIFIDSRSDTLNLDETQLADLITPRTRAIIATHCAGVACEMDAIRTTAARHNVPVVEDNAHGLFGKYQGEYLGTLGCLATQSFHETKNFTCGEGGALLINDRQYLERAEILREKGTNRSRFFRGQVDKYTWVDVGSSYQPADLLAAILYAQLEARDVIQAKRRRVWEYYSTHLPDWAAANGVQLPCVPDGCEQPDHLFYLLLPSLEARQALIVHLKERGIASAFHYLALNTSTMGLQLGGRPGQCPVAESASDRLLRLPFFNSLTDAELAEVVAAVRDFTCP
jgi:dTDP-4-amino-4,6-dideoxygalactose transaminase